MCFRSSSEEHICSDSCTKMEGELAALMDMFHSVKRAGRSATLTLSTNNGKATQVRFAIELDDALHPPSTSSSTSTSAAPTSTPATGSRRHLWQQLHLQLIQEEMRELLPPNYRHLLMPRGCYNLDLQPFLVKPGKSSRS